MLGDEQKSAMDARGTVVIKTLDKRNIAVISCDH